MITLHEITYAEGQQYRYALRNSNMLHFLSYFHMDEKIKKHIYLYIRYNVAGVQRYINTSD
jgi:hypothetical protein